MLERTRPLVLTLALACISACDSKPADADAKPADAATKAAGDKKADEKPKADDLDPSKPSADWPNEALTKTENEVDGIAFSIELPAGVKPKVKKGDGTLPGYVTWNGANPLMDPTITVQIDSFPPADLEAVGRKVKTHPQPAEAARQEQLEDGGMLFSMVETSKKFVSVRVWRTSPSTKSVVRVTLQHRDGEPIANLDALRAWMEKIAVSFQPK